MCVSACDLCVEVMCSCGVSAENVTTDVEHDEVSGIEGQDETVETFSRVHCIPQQTDVPLSSTQVQSVSDQPATYAELNISNDNCGACETVSRDAVPSAELLTISHKPVTQDTARDADSETATKCQESSYLIDEGLSCDDVIGKLTHLSCSLMT